VLGFILCCSKQHNTFSEWAIQIGLVISKKLSRQAIFDRITDKAATFARQLLQHFIVEQRCTHAKERKRLFEYFGKVLLQDSTTLRLPQFLANLYPGSIVNGVQKAIARIQTVIDIKTMRFVDFKLCAYTQNDQSASKDILSIAQQGDLVIRDMGYFASDAFEAMINKGVFFLSRLRYGVNIYDEKGNIILLKKLLGQNKVIDRWVYIGSKNKIRVRLIMIPLPAAIAAERIRKAKTHPDKRFNHDKQYYQWLQYSAFITTVAKDVWTAKTVAKVYRLRWQIEIIFKSWKSGFSLQTVLHERCTDKHRVEVCIWLMLLFICLFMQKIYMPYKEDIELRIGKAISLLKLSNFISKNIMEIFRCSLRFIKEQIELHCCYDKHSNRMNMTDLLNNFKN